MDTFQETRKECRDRYKKTLAICALFFLAIVTVDLLVFTHLSQFRWESYIFPVCILLIFLWPPKQRVVRLSMEEISTDDTAYPISSITKIEVRKNKFIIHAAGMSNWHLPIFAAISHLPESAIQYNSSIEIKRVA